jgi:hypothetical protein
MPKPAKEYIILNTADPKEALEAISFPIIRVPLTCEIEGKKIELPKEAIFREKPLAYYETLSPGYAVIKHETAFRAMMMALRAFAWRLRRVSLDQEGAQMTARFTIDETHAVGENDIVCPEVYLTNSYNTATALTLHLGCFRQTHETVALCSGDFKSRWMHLGNKADPDELKIAIESALRDFKQTVVPTYEKMAAMSLTDLQAIEVIITAVKKDILPAKWAKYAIDRIKKENQPNSMWSVFNALTWATTHGFKGTPTRLMEIQQKIARHFKDGGTSFLEHKPEIKPEEVEKWLQKSVGLQVA